MTKKNPIFKDLDTYLEAIGVDMLEPTNCYELARFKANNETCIIYQKNNGTGRSFNNPLAEKIWQSFYDRKLINIQSEKRKTIKEKFFEKLIERDGNLCFYSNKEMTKEQASIEHLIPLSKGGKNNMDNLVLCLKDENLKMGNLPLVEKIKYKILNIK
jgi:5-methylcytosine-specific restriction endonuclease McrA